MSCSFVLSLVSDWVVVQPPYGELKMTMELDKLQMTGNIKASSAVI